MASPARMTDSRSRFDRFAEAASRFASQAAFFTIAAVLVAVWLPTVFLFESIDTWQLVLNTITSVLAFLLIALLQNSERRYDRALHAKVDALAEGITVLLRQARESGDREAERALADLEASIELEKRT